MKADTCRRGHLLQTLPSKMFRQCMRWLRTCEQAYSSRKFLRWRTRREVDRHDSALRIQTTRRTQDAVTPLLLPWDATFVFKNSAEPCGTWSIGKCTVLLRSRFTCCCTALHSHSERTVFFKNSGFWQSRLGNATSLFVIRTEQCVLLQHSCFSYRSARRGQRISSLHFCFCCSFSLRQRSWGVTA